MEYSIRELAELAGVSARTIRYYGEIGLLKPLYVKESGYRFYGPKELDILQQILFYRERGFDLKSIGKILNGKNFDIMGALEEHLLCLEEQKSHTEELIRTVRQTIAAMKGECEMSDKEKFEAFKAGIVKENEEKYGAEVRERYGDAQMEASNQKLMQMSKEDWDSFRKLEEEIKNRLREGVRTGIQPESEAAGQIVRLHKDWLCKTWKQYSVEAHKGVASLYVADDRFRQYYDSEVEGCAELLKQAIEYWADKI